jgi:hypothetical protein
MASIDAPLLQQVDMRRKCCRHPIGGLRHPSVDRARARLEAWNDGLVGFNPFRPQKRRASDYALVVAAFVVIALLLAWALIPR